MESDPRLVRLREFARVLGPLLTWLAIVALATGLLWALRSSFDKAHMALTYLLIVLAGSARHGRGVGMGLAFTAFLCFNFFLLPPYHTFAVENPVDWLVLLAFLVTGTVAAQLLYRAQQQAEIARRRADEMERLSTLGAETLSIGGTEAAVQAIARVVQTTLRIALCDIYRCEADGGELRLCGASAARRPIQIAPPDERFRRVVDQRVIAVAQADGSVEYVDDRQPMDETLARGTGARALMVPLLVRGRVVGVLRLADDAAITLDAAQARFATVLSYYAALGVERVRLVAEEERASALREADRLKDALLASVSHDLRTPLTTIRALAEEIASAGDRRAAAIEEEAQRLTRLVEDILDLSRLDARALPLKAETVAVEDLVGAALRRIAGMQEDRQIRTDFPMGEGMLFARMDFTQSMRILVNLLENALKYSPGGEAVLLRVRARAETVTFEVMDRGAGVRAGDVPRIFEPFYRSRTGEPDVGGAGLGLSIALRLAEGQGGSLRHAPRRGGGSIFTLTLPRAEISHAAEPPDSAAAAVDAVSTPTIRTLHIPIS